MLYPHQARAIEQLARHPHKLAILAYEQGLGKTLIALRDFRPPGVAVVPAFLLDNWKAEAAMWRPDLRVKIMRPGIPFDPGALNITSYGMVSKLALPPSMETLILDEAHFCKNPDAARTQMCGRLIHSARRVRALTGTPVVTKTIADVWALLFSSGATSIPWLQWAKYFCGAYRDKFGNLRMGRPAHTIEALPILEPVMLRLTKEEALQLPAKVRRTILLRANEPVQCAGFDPAEIERNPNPLSFVGLSEAMRIAGELKAHEAAGYINDVLEDSPGPIVVFAHHRSVIDTLDLLIRAKSAVITGDTPFTERTKIVRQFQEGELRVLIGSIGAMGTGITLTAARHAIMVEAPWSYAVAVQAEDRLHRIGQELPVLIDYLCVPRSLDHQVVERMLDKRQIAHDVLDRKRLELADTVARLIPA